MWWFFFNLLQLKRMRQFFVRVWPDIIDWWRMIRPSTHFHSMSPRKWVNHHQTFYCSKIAFFSVWYCASRMAWTLSLLYLFVLGKNFTFSDPFCSYRIDEILPTWTRGNFPFNKHHWSYYFFPIIILFYWPNHIINNILSHPCLLILFPHEINSW